MSQGEIRDSDCHRVDDREAAVLVLMWDHQSKPSTRGLGDDIASFREKTLQLYYLECWFLK